MEKIEQARVCSKCGLKEHRYLSVANALNEKMKYCNMPCSRCGGRKFDHTYQELPSISKESMEAWSNNEDAWFIGQDEDLMFDEENIDLLFEFLDKKTTIKSKKYILLQALCNMLPYSEIVKIGLLQRLDIFEELKGSKEICTALFSSNN